MNFTGQHSPNLYLAFTSFHAGCCILESSLFRPSKCGDIFSIIIKVIWHWLTCTACFITVLCWDFFVSNNYRYFRNDLRNEVPRRSIWWARGLYSHEVPVWWVTLLSYYELLELSVMWCMSKSTVYVCVTVYLCASLELRCLLRSMFLK